MGSHYNVAPRYTPGSPALVPRDVAERVAHEEKRFVEHALSGAWGERNKAMAERLGLRGIVELRTERRDHWEILDLCTGERFKRLFPDKLRKLGYRTYQELQGWERKLLDESPPGDVPDYRDRGWFKVEVVPFGSTPTGYRIDVYRPEPLRGQ